MAAEISLMRSHLSYNKCAQGPGFPQLCTDPPGGDRRCLLIVPRLFPSDILPQMPPCMLTVSGHLSHTCYFLSKTSSKSKHFYGFLSTATQVSLHIALQFFFFSVSVSFTYTCTLPLKIFPVYILRPQGKLQDPV